MRDGTLETLPKTSSERHVSRVSHPEAPRARRPFRVCMRASANAVAACGNDCRELRLELTRATEANGREAMGRRLQAGQPNLNTRHHWNVPLRRTPPEQAIVPSVRTPHVLA